MQRITVTGAAGRMGRMVVADLLAHGYEVLGVDRVKPESSPCRFLVADMTSASAIYDVLRGADAAIHLAAVPGPISEPQTATFENNVLSTYHVAEAAAALGLKRLVWASSVFTLGWVEAADRYWPQYLPVDEDHPLTPFEAYGLSKVIGEEIMAAVSRRTGLPTVSLRIMNVIQPGGSGIQPGGYAAFPWPTPTREAGTRFVMWPYVDARDAARSCRLALEAETTGHEAMFIAAEDIRFDANTRELLSELAPQVEIRGPLAGRASVISIEKAKRLIGFEPEYEWQNQQSKT